MAKVRVLRRHDKAYIELPAEVGSCSELEIFRLKDGYYLLSVPLGQHAAAEPQPLQKEDKNAITEAEKAVLRKLLSIRFEKRTPAYVGKALSEEEKNVLEGLEIKGLVNVFKGSKYKDGVYNISDEIYALIHPRYGEHAAQPDRTYKQKPSTAALPSQPRNTFDLLRSRGFAVIQDKKEAMELSEQLNSEMKSGAVMGVKGFDGKFYVVTKGYFSTAHAAIGRVLKGAMDAAAIASAAKLEPDGCLAILRLMAENGDIIEKKKGVFAPV